MLQQLSQSTADTPCGSPVQDQLHEEATVDTLFGRRWGRVQFTLQREAALRPAFFAELSTPIGSLVKEIVSGLVRVALECGKSNDGGSGGNRSSRGVKLLEEPTWRVYCNERKCGFAMRKDCGEKELRIFKAIEPISMGAGVLPREEGDEDIKDKNGTDGEGEMTYMRAKFERIVGSRDCEAYYMMNLTAMAPPSSASICSGFDSIRFDSRMASA